MMLRNFGALHDVAGNRTSTIVFAIPMDLLAALKSRRSRKEPVRQSVPADAPPTQKEPGICDRPER